ncbi:bifunctional diguanylate cyclase/phosphodiesterase [Pseudoxanthomonas gei]|nr:EAL domain-containing protein [Pseudoxanthomonas gei]
MQGRKPAGGLPGLHVLESGDDRNGLSARATYRYGLLLAALLGLVLVAILVVDRARRLAEAEREVSTLAVGARGQVYYALRDAERALLFAARTAVPQRAAGAAGSTPVPGPHWMADLLAEHPELSDLHVVAADESGITHWAYRGKPGESPMRLGAPRRDTDGAWILPLAVPLPGQPGWITANYRLGALQELVERMKGGGPALITLMDSRRYILARTMAPESTVGTQIHEASLARQIASGVESVIDQHMHPVDGVARIRAYQASMYYPLEVASGLPRRHVLMPWYVLATLGALGYALYWAGFLHQLRIVRRADARQTRLLERIGRSGELLSFALRAGKMGAWAMQADGELWWSDEVAPLHGVDPADTEVGEPDLIARLHPDDRERVLQRLESLRERGEALSLDYRVITADGRVRYLSTRGARFNTPSSDIVTSGVVLDVTDQVEAAQRLLDAERQFRLMFDRNPLPFWVFDIDTLRFLEVNQAAISNYGYSRDEFLAMTLNDIRPASESLQLLRDVAEGRAVDSPQVWTHRRKDGSELEARVHAADIEFSGQPARLVLAEDVSEQHRVQRELAYRANHDLLTALPNEMAFAHRLQELMSLPGQGVNVVRVTLQRHGLISDSLGTGVGDEVLVQAAARLIEQVPEPGVVARMQGAEFILATPATDADPRGERLLAALSEAMGAPVRAADASHYLDAAFGLAMYPGDGATADVLVRNAGLAARDATQQLATDTVRYSAGLAGTVSSRLEMLARVQQAIESGGFELHFQPIFDLATNQVCCYEALARWPQPGGGFIPPQDFIPLCEDSALIVPFGRWVLHEAAHAWLRFASAGQPACPIAVNVSVSQFTRSDLVAELRTLIEVHGLPPGAIELELTEGVVMGDPEQVIATLAELRAMGVLLAIDDFGTGYSNLSYLRRLPAHTLKIDRVFVHQIETDPQNAAICRSIMALATLFGMRVTAEGIETPAQLQWFRDNGGHMAQGFLLGRPVPQSALLASPARMLPREPLA